MNVTVTKKNESVIYNGKIYSHGQSFEVDELIGKSLMERGYVSEAAQEPPAGENPLEGLSYAQLKKLAAERGVAATGKREELIARIAEAENDAAEEQDDTEEATDDLPNTDMPE